MTHSWRSFPKEEWGSVSRSGYGVDIMFTVVTPSPLLWEYPSDIYVDGLIAVVLFCMFRRQPQAKFSCGKAFILAQLCYYIYSLLCVVCFILSTRIQATSFELDSNATASTKYPVPVFTQQVMCRT